MQACKVLDIEIRNSAKGVVYKNFFPKRERDTGLAWRAAWVSPQPMGHGPFTALGSTSGFVVFIQASISYLI